MSSFAQVADTDEVVKAMDLVGSDLGRSTSLPGKSTSGNISLPSVKRIGSIVDDMSNDALKPGGSTQFEGRFQRPGRPAPTSRTT